VQCTLTWLLHPPIRFGLRQDSSHPRTTNGHCPDDEGTECLSGMLWFRGASAVDRALADRKSGTDHHGGFARIPPHEGRVLGVAATGAALLARPIMSGAQFTAAILTSGMIDDDTTQQRRHSARHAAAKVPLSLKLILLVLFVPPELSIFFGDLRFTLERLLLILLTPFVTVRLVQKVASGDYRFVASDLFVPLAALWMFVGPAVTYDMGYALHHSGPVVLEFLITYASTRVLLSGHGQALLFINMLCVLIVFVVMDAALDTATGTYITRELSSHVTGYLDFRINSDLYRLGLLRAMGPIEHPILFGFTCAISFMLSIAVKIRWRGFCIAGSALGLLLSLSSAPQQCTIMGLALLIYGRVLAGQHWKWHALEIGAGAFAILLFVSTPTPFGHLFDLFTIDPQTAYFRLYIWNMVGPAILQNPFFSVTATSYDYQGSVDAVWLYLALLYGMPCAILTGLSMLGSCSLPTDPGRAQLLPEESRLGNVLGIVIFMIVYMGFTVDYWGITWILIGLLVGVRAHIGELGRIEDGAAWQDSWLGADTPRS
jgi:hypothetical protein